MLWIGLFLLSAGFLAAAGVVFGIKARMGGRGVRPWLLALVVCYTLVFGAFAAAFFVKG